MRSSEHMPVRDQGPAAVLLEAEGRDGGHPRPVPRVGRPGSCHSALGPRAEAATCVETLRHHDAFQM